MRRKHDDFDPELDERLSAMLNAAREVEEVGPIDVWATLHAFARDLTEAAAAGALPRAYGREVLVERLLRAIADPANGYVVLSGPPEVGKTTLAYEVAYRVHEGACPEPLRGKRVFAFRPDNAVVNLGIPDWHRRLRALFQALCEDPQVILFVEDLHMALRTGAQIGQPLDVADVTRMALERRRMFFFGEADEMGWRFLSWEDAGFVNIFTPFHVPVMGVEETREVLHHFSRDLAEKEGVRITPEAMEVALDLTDRFIVRQALPGKAIRLLNSALVEVKRRGVDPAVVAGHDVLDVFSEQSGLPVAFLDDEQPLDVEAVRRFFTRRVMGQPHAVEAVVQMISLIKARLNDPQRPLGVFFFLGPTGVGKTELARTLSAYLFGREDRLVRFDMASLAGEQASQVLFGTPYGELRQRRGQFTERIGDGLTVVLLDEFEKAYEDLYHHFLPIFDEGRFRNALGEEVDVRNCIFILTSNLGADVFQQGRLGFPQVGEREDIERALLSETVRFFAPEFINRMDAVVFFKVLDRDTVRRIAQRELNVLLQRAGIRRRNLTVDVSEEVLDWLVEQGYSERFGARYLRRQVERLVTFPVARELVGKPQVREGLLRIFLRGRRVDAVLLRPEEERPPEVVTVEEEGKRKQVTLAELVKALPRLQGKVQQMLDRYRLHDLRAQQEELLAEMASPTFWDEPERARMRLALLADISRRVDLLEGLQGTLADLAASTEAWQEGDRDFIPAAVGAYHRLRRALARTELYLLLTGPHDQEDAFVIVSSRSDQAAAPEWVQTLAAMYQRWAQKRQMEVRVVTETHDAEGRLQRVVLFVGGEGAYGLLRGESGVHRLVHSADNGREVVNARVAVLPVLEYRVTPQQLRTRRQSVQGRGRLLRRLRSQVTVSHVPSGLSVVTTNDLPAPENERWALRLLQAYLAAQEVDDPNADLAPRDAVWADVIRTYNRHREHHVRDHRTNTVARSVERVLEGRIDGFLLAYLRHLNSLRQDVLHQGAV